MITGIFIAVSLKESLVLFYDQVSPLVLYTDSFFLPQNCHFY